MKKYIFLTVLSFILSSCGTSKELYSWSRYQKASYNYLKKADEKSTELILDEYKKVISTQKGIRKAVPPGIYADYGFLLIQKGNLTEGVENLKKEVQFYPESKIFIDRILKLIEK
jgi:hypothetical protein